jgi:hypothetical protein
MLRWKGCPVNITEITRVSLRNGYESHGFGYGSCGKRGFTHAPIADCRLTAPQDDSLEIKPQWSSALVSPGLHAAVGRASHRCRPVRTLLDVAGDDRSRRAGARIARRSVKAGAVLPERPCRVPPSTSINYGFWATLPTVRGEPAPVIHHRKPCPQAGAGRGGRVGGLFA